MYQVKNVKTGPSREYGPNGAYTCSLYRDGKCIAIANEYGDGGEMNIEWLGERTEVYEFGLIKQKVTPEQLAFAEFCETQTYECEWSKKTETYDSNLYVAELVEKFLTAKQIKGWCRTKTVIRLKGDGAGEYRTFKCKYNPKVKAQLEARYGDKLVELVNERFVA